MIELNTPIAEADIRRLVVGDSVSLSGVIVTARDAAHKYMTENFIATGGRPPEAERDLHYRLKDLLEGSVLYHCGPVVDRDGEGNWRFVAAGPTTSAREDPYQAGVIDYFKLRGVIGKGGMGERTMAGLIKTGACYFHAIGGAASVIAECCKEVIEVHKMEEFGTPEAFWVLRVENFPLVVTMDSKGGSLHQEIAERSRTAREGMV
jgi:fumarate hydratase class I